MWLILGQDTRPRGLWLPAPRPFPSLHAAFWPWCVWGLQEDLARAPGSELEKTRGRQRGALGSSVFDVWSFSLRFVFCKTWYISVQKGYLLKNPHCPSGTG